ncbi:MAG: dynamin family protein [Campylobacterales bacterium]
MESREELISKLRRGVKIGMHLLQKPGLLQQVGIDPEKLRREVQIAGRLAEKLERNQFEVAIVGLENSGKSTFANALVGGLIFPSADRRCTYTSAQLKYHPTDRARIILYTEEEFQALFQQLLRELGYPNWEQVNFRNLTVSQFEQQIGEKRNSTDERIVKLIRELREILECQSSLQLTGDILEFEGNQIYSPQFQVYITGEEIGGDVDVGKPRSVKSIEIFSSQLREFRNGVIYDVPGFDSPIFLHHQQTIERLQNADALILITSLDKPNLNIHQLTLLRESDRDGIPLSEKTFVYGNKLDTKRNPEDREKATQALKRDVIKEGIAKSDRILFGSAKKYLLERGILSASPEELSAFQNVPSNVEELRKKLEEYFRNERFQILRRRGEEAIQQISAGSHQILQWWHQNFSPEQIAGARNRIILRLGNRVRNALKRAVYQERTHLKLNKSNKLAEKLKVKIRERGGLEELDRDSPIISEALHRIDALSPIENIEKFEQEVRNILTTLYLNRFTRIVAELGEEEFQEVLERIIQRFFENLGRREPRLGTELRKTLLQLWQTPEEREAGFRYVVERFTRLLFDLLLETRRDSKDRLTKYQNNKEEIEFLTYYLKDKKKLNDAIDASSIRRGGRPLNSNSRNRNRNPHWEGMEPVLADVNRDIQLLVEILVEGSIDGINPDLVFLAIIDKDLLKILDMLRDGELDEKLSRFIGEGVELLRGEMEGELREMEQLHHWIEELSRLS